MLCCQVKDLGALEASSDQPYWEGPRLGCYNWCDCCWESSALKQSYFLSLKCPWAVLRLPTRRDPCGSSLCSGIAHPWSRALEQGWNDPLGLAVVLLQQRGAQALPFQGLFAPHPPEQPQSCKYNDWMRKEPWEPKLGVWNRFGALENSPLQALGWWRCEHQAEHLCRTDSFLSVLLFKASSNSKRTRLLPRLPLHCSFVLCSLLFPYHPLKMVVTCV